MRIMPSGNGSMDWLPKNLVKTASRNGGTKEKDPRDALYEAARKVVANMDSCCGEESSQSMGGSDFMGSINKVDSGVDGVEFEGEVAEVAEGSDDAVVESLEKAKSAIEDAVDLLGGSAEVEVEIEDNGDDDIEIEVEDDNDGFEYGQDSDDEDVDDVDVEGTEKSNDNKPAFKEYPKNDCPSKSNKSDNKKYDEDKGMEIEKESSNDGWVKLSAISPNNRKKIMDYWSRQLGYPKEYVKLMAKDFEK